MRILKPEEIKQPKGSKIIEESLKGTHPIMGATEQFNMGAYAKLKLGEFMPEIFPGGDASPFCEDKRLQRNGIFDPDDCVICSFESMIEGSAKAQGFTLPIPSRRYTALKANVVPGQGTSDDAVQKAILKWGLIPEDKCVSMDATMTTIQYFANLAGGLEQFEMLLKDYDVIFTPLPTRDGVSVPLFNIACCLPFSMVVVSVDGRYLFDNQGRVVRSKYEDNHDVCVVRAAGAIQDNLILDSENSDGFVRFAPDYDFHYPVFIYLKKKVMFRLAKTESSHSVFLLCEASMLRLGIADSEDLTGGELLKTFSGTYGNAAIQTITEEEMAKYTWLKNIGEVAKPNPVITGSTYVYINNDGTEHTGTLGDNYVDTTVKS